jgi:hypothetical protein
VGNSTKKGKAWYLPAARADILLSRSVTACSGWMRSLLASARAFSAFFALANADLVDFSVVVLVAVTASQAFLEASSSASRDEMRALAAAKSSVVQEEERKLNKRVTEAQRQANKRYRMAKSLPWEDLTAFKNSTHSVPKETNFFIKVCPR